MRRSPASGSSRSSASCSRTSTPGCSTSRRSARGKRCCSAGASGKTPWRSGTGSRTASQAGNRSTGTNREDTVSHFWQRIVIAAIVIVVASVVAKIVDWRIARHDLELASATRYRVLRKSIVSVILFVGVMSALLVIPQVRALAGGVLASSAVVGLVIGFASQLTIGNVVAGILIAVTQPLRLGDEVEIEGDRGIVQAIGLTYTWIRTPDRECLVGPNAKLASTSINHAPTRLQDTPG